MILYGFDPIIAPHPRLMVLGSMPSVVSLEQQEYYGFKHNRFWKIMAAYYSTSFLNYEDKVACIKSHEMLLWDVIGNCERVGSLDSAIRNSKVNDIAGIIEQYPSITHIICNGKKSYELYMRHFADLNIHVMVLPSTSNANRTIKEVDVFETWFDALDKVYGKNVKRGNGNEGRNTASSI